MDNDIEDFSDDDFLDAEELCALLAECPGGQVQIVAMVFDQHKEAFVQSCSTHGLAVIDGCESNGAWRFEIEGTPREIALSARSLAGVIGFEEPE